MLIAETKERINNIKKKEKKKKTKLLHHTFHLTRRDSHIRSFTQAISIDSIRAPHIAQQPQPIIPTRPSHIPPCPFSPPTYAVNERVSSPWSDP